jgi:pimeloyl-ACP methyl ester carboxylesterase
MIKAFGPANWCTEMMFRWAGKNPTGLNILKANDALTVYGKFMEQDHTIDATCKDYEAGATVDVQAQEEDQKEGRKIKAPLLLVYGDDYIGSRFNMQDVWKEWVDDGVDIQTVPLGDGIGHFGAEEAPSETAKALNEWLKSTVGRE